MSTREEIYAQIVDLTPRFAAALENCRTTADGSMDLDYCHDTLSELLDQYVAASAGEA